MHRHAAIALLSAVLFAHGCTVTQKCYRERPPRDVDGQHLRVMSFNIRYGTARDGNNRWENRRELVFDVLRDHVPDIVGLQEAFDWQLDELIATMPHFWFVGVGRDDGIRDGEFAAVLYRTDRLTVLDQGTFWFSDGPTEPGSTGWGNAIPRICTWARLEPKNGRQPFYVFNVHLDHASQRSRKRSVELLTARIHARAHGDPVIVTGDFNAGEKNRVIRHFAPGQPGASLQLVDTFRALHPDERTVGTFNSFRGASHGKRIDYIFAPRNTQVVEAAIIRDNDGGRYPSDHYPVLATMELP